MRGTGDGVSVTEDLSSVAWDLYHARISARAYGPRAATDPALAGVRERLQRAERAAEEMTARSAVRVAGDSPEAAAALEAIGAAQGVADLGWIEARQSARRTLLDAARGLLRGEVAVVEVVAARHGVTEDSSSDGWAAGKAACVAADMALAAVGATAHAGHAGLGTAQQWAAAAKYYHAVSLGGAS